MAFPESHFFRKPVRLGIKNGDLLTVTVKARGVPEAWLQCQKWSWKMGRPEATVVNGVKYIALRNGGKWRAHWGEITLLIGVIARVELSRVLIRPAKAFFGLATAFFWFEFQIVGAQFRSTLLQISGSKTSSSEVKNFKFEDELWVKKRWQKHH